MLMEIGIHLSYWTKNWQDDLIGAIECSGSCGFESVDIPLLSPGDFAVQPVKEALAINGLSATCGTGLSLERDISSGDKGCRQRGIEHLKRCIELCARLNSSVLGGVLFAPWGHFPDTDLDSHRTRSLDSMRQVAAVAEDYGVDLCVEVLNRFETYMFNTVEQALEYIKAVESPRMKLHFDTFHANIEEDNICKAIRLAGPHLGHLHCSENNRKLPGHGHIPWTGVGLALKDISYTRAAQVECFVQPDCEVGRGTFTWRRLTHTLEADAGAAFQFLHKNLRQVTL
jgi:D-psicose/D-tagatose/L-ribulose 3-epimerase